MIFAGHEYLNQCRREMTHNQCRGTKITTGQISTVKSTWGTKQEAESLSTSNWNISKTVLPGGYIGPNKSNEIKSRQVMYQAYSYYSVEPTSIIAGYSRIG